MARRHVDDSPSARKKQEEARERRFLGEATRLALEKANAIEREWSRSNDPGPPYVEWNE